ncbi:MAG: energy transducer TonB [Ignavibacteria bacterium]|nr:energy transducer TonB [Ignavibacteria bacterium]
MKTAAKEKKQNSLGNMLYGAPELLSLYQKYAFRGLIGSIALALFALGGIITYNSLHADENDAKNYDRKIFEIVEFDMPVKDKTIVEVPPKIEEPQTVKTVALKDLGALTPDPVAKEKSEVLTSKTQGALDNVDKPVSHDGTEDPNKVTAGLDDINKNKIIGENIIKDEPKKPKDEGPKNPYQVDKAPVAVNLNSVRGSMKYPEIARQVGTEGTCTARILVGTSGEILKVVSLSGPDVFYSEIKDKIMNLQFTPALLNGEPVKCYVAVPFKFSLNK